MKPYGRWRSLFLFLSMFGFGSASYGQEQVDYVRICDPFGPNWFYSPGNDTCVNALTGETRVQTEFGLMQRDSALAARVRAMESFYCDECFAVVRHDGATEERRGVKGSSRTAVGQYEVQFRRRADKCALHATLDHSINPGPGMLSAALSSSNRETVSVHTYDAGGLPEDKAFHLSLECKPKRFFCKLTSESGTTRCAGDEAPP